MTRYSTLMRFKSTYRIGPFEAIVRVRAMLYALSVVSKLFGRRAKLVEAE